MIGFLHPGIAIAAAVAVALPIAIHLLFRRRRVAIDWAAMELLREAVRRTNRRLRMEQWIVLALRALAVLAAGLAIASPLLSGSAPGDGGEARTWMVVLDDGPTSALRSGRADELSRLRSEVRAALAGRGPRDRLGLVLAAAPARMALAPTSDVAQFERLLDAALPRETPTRLEEAMDLARAALAAESGGSAAKPGTIVVASAFRRASVGASADVAPSDAADGDEAFDVVAIVPATDDPTDVRVERIEARPAPIGDSVIVRVLLSRAGGSLEAARTDVRASADGCNDPMPRAIAWEAGQTEASVEFQLVPSDVRAARSVARAVRVSIGDDVLPIGNAASTSIEVGRDLEVGVVGRRGALDVGDLEKLPASLWVARALAPTLGDASAIRIREIDPSGCDARALLGLDAVVVARPDLLSPSAMDALAAFVGEGRLAIVLPAGESLAQGWSGSLFTKLGVPLRTSAEANVPETPLRLAEEQPTSGLLSALAPELPALVAPVECARVLAFEGHSPGDVVLSFANGAPFVTAQRPGGGGLVIAFASTAELSWTNLPVKPLIVPLLQELVRAGLETARGGEDAYVGDRIESTPGSTLLGEKGETLLVGDDGRSESIAPHSGILRSDAGAVVAVNVRGESIALAPTSKDAVRAMLSGSGRVRFPATGDAEDAGARGADGARRSGVPLASILLALTIVLLLAEGALSRVFSHASVARASSETAVRSTVGRTRSGRTTTPAGRALVGGGRT